MEQEKKSSNLLKIGLAVFVGIGLLALYMKFQNATLALEADALRSTVQKMEQDIAPVKIPVKKEKKIPWPEIIERARRSIPKLKDLDEPLVSVISYAGEGDEMRMEAVTRERAFNPMNDVTIAFDALRNEKIFSGARFDSLAKSQNGTSTRVHFSITIPFLNP